MPLAWGFAGLGFLDLGATNAGPPAIRARNEQDADERDGPGAAP